MLFLCTPNNPTGVTLPRGLLEAALRICRAQGTRVLLDECFLDFTDAASAKDLLEAYPNLLILKAFTKNYALAGVRAGYCLTADRQLLEKMSACSQPWNVSVPAQAAALAGLAGKDPPADRGAKGRAHRGPHGPRPDGLPVAGQLSAVPRPSRAGHRAAAAEDRHPQLRELPRTRRGLVPHGGAAAGRK